MRTPVTFSNTYADLPDRFFARLNPTPVKAPELIKFNEKLADDLGLDPDFFTSPEGVNALAGNTVLDGSAPLAMAYAGQQFGHWNPQLGDGHALLLGEVIAPSGVRYDLQLKGSGPTPFSRMGDGRAWLGPVLREYIVSEAMAALGVPTTRALAAVATGEQVVRENILPGAIVTRVARSHIRVGTFQYFTARQDTDGLKTLADYAIDRLHPAAREQKNAYVGLLQSVVKAQAELVAKWMNLGFIHGVMNTDNVAISGETIDYGPCAFMDDFDPDKVFSSIDEAGRYAYSNQPRIAHWNVVQFAQSLLPLLGETDEDAIAVAQKEVNAFPKIYGDAYQLGMNAKLGLGDVQTGDDELASAFLAIMAEQKLDFTNTFRTLLSSPEDLGLAFAYWLSTWNERTGGTPDTASMTKANPAFIPRNHRIEQVIRAALEGDHAPFHRLVDVLKKPFDEQPVFAELIAPPEPKEIVHYTFCGT